MKIYSLIIVCLITLFSSCNNKSKNSATSEGQLVFNIAYSKAVSKNWSFILPKNMTMTFKDDKYKIETSASGFMNSSFISDCQNKQLIMTLEMGLNKIYAVLDEKTTNEMLNLYPKYEIVESNLNENIINFPCKVYYGVFENIDDGKDVTLYASNSINIKESNWCNKFKDVKGVLLKYQANQFGIDMTFTADSLYSNVSISDSIFNIPANFEKVDYRVFIKEMEDLSSSLTGR